jgi:hypothetical protein
MNAMTFAHNLPSARGRFLRWQRPPSGYGGMSEKTAVQWAPKVYDATFRDTA